MWNRNDTFCSNGFQPVPCGATAIIAMFLLVGCASYTVPGPGANMERIGVTRTIREASTDGVIQKAFDKKPLANFPTGVAVVRVQGPGYSSPTAQSYGQGAYSVVTTRDVEKPEQI